jgi:hypothetical protein
MNGQQVNNLRQRVERELGAILRDEYGLNVEADTPVRYYLDFKTNRRLLELQDVLQRMDRGAFGICMVCGGSISEARLTDFPAARFCDPCLPATPTVMKASRRVRVRTGPATTSES